MYFRGGLGDDTTDTTVAPAIDVSSVVTALATAANSPVQLGAFGSTPLWALGAVAMVIGLMLNAVANKASDVGNRVSKRAGKIKRGFTG